MCISSPDSDDPTDEVCFSLFRTPFVTACDIGSVIGQKSEKQGLMLVKK